MASTIQQTGGDEESGRERIIQEAIGLIAVAGIRGATLRDLAARCGASAASIAYLFGNKDGLIAECFARLVRADHDRLARLAEEAEAMDVAPELAGALLWTLCEEAAGDRRFEMLALVELWLAAPANPRFARICGDWLRGRRDAFRRFAAAFGADPLAFDILGLHLLSESSFAVSCHGSASYRLVARAGFLEATARLTGLGEAGPSPEMVPLARRFFADPETGRPQEAAEARTGGRGAESRARMIDAAASIIEEEGLAAVTNRAVAERAAVSLALTTYHFKSVTELAFAGILRVFEKVNAGFAHDAARAPSAATMVDRIRRRSQPSGVERLRSRGMAEISLAAAREGALEPLGLAMRRQRGTITHAGLGRRGGDVTRTRAASHALWASAVFLTGAATPESDSLFDFEAQARLAAAKLLNID